MELTDIRTVKSIMEKYGLRFQKKFGQNFLVTKGLPDRIASECGVDKNSAVLEIGPGIGTLTYSLCKVAKKVVALEIDKNLLPVLSETLGEFENVKVINSDVMKTDLTRLVEEEFGGLDVYVCANLPYYITTPILMLLLESGIKFKKLTFMVQKEVADRLSSKAGDSDYGAVTASVAYYGEVKKLFNVTAGNFMPPPKVDSAIIQIDLYDKPPFEVKDKILFFNCMKFAFEMRRKTLVNALKGKVGVEKGKLIEIVEDLFGDANIRGERLSVNDFGKLSDYIKSAQ